MKLTKYRTELNDDGLNCLVKEETRLYPDAKRIRNPEDIVAVMNNVYRLDKMAEEYVYEITMDAKGKVLGVFEISHGTADSSVVAARDVMKRALLVGAINVIVVHNHPSGVAEPSSQDMDVAKKLNEAGKLLDINVSDFVIIGAGGEYVSFADKKLLEK